MATSKIRKNFSTMTIAEQQRYCKAVYDLKHHTSGDLYDYFPKTHFAYGPTRQSAVSFQHEIHWNIAFMAWHRAFLLVFEEKLREIDSEVTIPYWNWTTHNSPDNTLEKGSLWSYNCMGPNGAGSDNYIPAPSTSIAPSVSYFDETQWSILFRSFPDPADTDPSTITTTPLKIRRILGGPSGTRTFPTPAHVKTLLDVKQFDATPYDGTAPTVSGEESFRNFLEGWLPLPGVSPAPPRFHNNGHVWVGGTMGNFNSPHDPVFFLHHAYIDYLWAKWQILHVKEAISAYPSDGDITTAQTVNPLAKKQDDPLGPWLGTTDPDFNPDGFTITTRQVMNHQEIFIGSLGSGSGPSGSGSGSGAMGANIGYRYDDDPKGLFKFQ